MKCPKHKIEMLALFTSYVCDKCDNPDKYELTEEEMLMLYPSTFYFGDLDTGGLSDTALNYLDDDD